MSSAGGQRAPAGLAASGRALWRAITTEFELESRELAILAAACRQADLVTQLEVLLANDGLTAVGSMGQVRLSSVVGELRQGRLCIAKLLSELRLPDENGKVMSPASLVAQQAAQERWRLERERRRSRG